MKIVITTSYLSEKFLIVLGIKWGIAAQQAISNDSDAPHIAGLVVTALQYLRCHVVRGPNSSLQQKWLASILKQALRIAQTPGWLGLRRNVGWLFIVLCKPEVDQSNLSIFALAFEKNVFRLHITMADS